MSILNMIRRNSTLDLVNKDIYDFFLNQNKHKKIVLSNEPFFHVVIDDFFSDFFIKLLSSSFSKVEFFRAPETTLGPNALMEYGFLNDKELLAKLFSSDFINFLSLVADNNLTFNQLCPPMFSIHKSGSKGLIIHNDKDQNTENDRDFVFICYLNEQWNSNWGGRLFIHNKEKYRVKAIEPAFNRVIMFSVSDNSWHSLEENYGRFDRRALYMDWIYKK